MKSIVVCIAFLLVISSAAVSHAKWRGQETEKDGVPHVTNPEAPVTEVRVELDELWDRGGEDDDVLFGQLTQLLHGTDGNLYVLDSQLSEIQVFDPAGEWLRTIGGQGEGPGEFSNAMDMYLGPNGLLGIVRIFPGRVYQLGTDGSPADYFPLPEPADGSFQLVYLGRANKDRIVLAGGMQRSESGKQLQVSHLKAYDTEGNELATFHEQSRATQFGGMKFDEKTFSDFTRRWALAADGRVAAALDFDDYRMHVWSTDGELQRVIERPGFEPLSRTGKEKERFQALFDGITRWNPGSTFKVSDTHASVAGVWFRDNGRLWVLSSRGMYEPEDGVFASFDEYDRDGRYVRRIHLVADGDPVEDGIFFAGDRMYRVTNLFSAFMASLGGDTEDDSEELMDPLRLVAYRLEMPEMDL